MDRERFQKSEREYFYLKGQLATGRITREQFDAALAGLNVRDESGREWKLDADSGKWFVRQSDAWVEADPYAPTPTAVPAPAATRSTPTPLWMALGLILFFCIVGIGTAGVLAGMGVLKVELSVFGKALPTSVTLLKTSTPTARSSATTTNTATSTFSTATLTTTITPTPLATTPSTTITATIPITFQSTPVVPTAYLAWDADFILNCDLFVGENEVRKYGCENNQYVMLNKQATTRYAYYDAQYGDAIIEAQGHWVSGEGKREYGIIFRGNVDGTLYYVFTVTDDGKYNVAVYKNDKYTDLIPYTVSPIVNTGSSPNRFKVVMQGSHFDFWLNDQYIGSVDDDSIASGITGFFLYNDQPNVQVAFDQLTVSTFDQQTPTPSVTIPAVTGSPTPNIPVSYVAWDADFGLNCDLFIGENEVRKYGCENNEYVMQHKQATTRYAYYDTTYDDGIIEAQGHWVSGDPPYEYGVIFRANEDGSLYYVFIVTQDGKYNVAVYKDGKYTNLIPYTASPIVNTGSTPNRFKIVMQGSHLDFFLNDQYVGAVDDDSIRSGVTGFFLYNDKPNVQVAFDQLTVSTFTPTTPSPATDVPNNEPTPTATPFALKPGVYVTNIRRSPAVSKRGQPVTFYPTFVNTTGRPQEYRWFVEIWEQDTSKRNPYGQADGIQRSIPAGTKELATGNSWKVAGGGPCQSFRARVVYQDNESRRIPFLTTIGIQYWSNFQVCP